MAVSVNPERILKILILLLILSHETFGNDISFQTTINIAGSGGADVQPVAIPSAASGPFTGRQFVLGRMNLNGYLSTTGGAVPKLSSYQEGQIRIGALVSGEPGSGNEVYKVYLYGRHGNLNLHPSAEVGPKVGEYFMTSEQINALISGSALDQAGKDLSHVNQSATTGRPCPSFAMNYAAPGDFSQPSYAGAMPNPAASPIASEGNATDRQNNRDMERYSGPRDNYEPPQGSAFIASGFSTATGDGSGLINARVNDEGEPTPGCEVLRGSQDRNADNPEAAWSKENLSRCIGAIQDRILAGAPQPITENTSNLAQLRNQILGRLFTLTNEEQEFAAAIFTLDGEVGGHSRENPMEGIMVLKVLANRRDNANEVQDALENCRRNNLDPGERAACMGQANSNNRYNLLDIALDDQQFSMYNSPANEGNWHSKFGTKTNPQFEDSINAFFLYNDVSQWNISGREGVDIHKIYHYHTPASRPGWRRDDLQLSIGGTHPELGEMAGTSVHVFYEDHDQKFHGRNGPDGWGRNVRHEFRTFR